MVKAKQKGGKSVVEAPEPDDTNVVDLMAALKASVDEKPGSGKAKPRSSAKSSRRKRA